MSHPSSKPQAWIAGCTAAHRRLDSLIADLTDEMARRPSLLEGWTVGHLLTHVARNADGLRGMVEGAQRDEIVAQYPGGQAQRNGDIESGAVRSAAELVADVKAANQKLEHAWTTTGEEVWAAGLGGRAKGPIAIADTAFFRWREVEVHLVDLALTELGGPDWDGLSPAYIDAEWPEMLAGLKGRVPEEITLLLAPGDRPSRAFGAGEERVVLRATPGHILAWLFGREADPALPTLRPWS